MQRLHLFLSCHTSGAPSPFYTMLMMNGWGVAFMSSWLLFDLLLSRTLPTDYWRTGELEEATAFVLEYPQVK